MADEIRCTIQDAEIIKVSELDEDIIKVELADSGSALSSSETVTSVLIQEDLTSQVSAGKTDYGEPFARLIDNRIHATVFAKWDSSSLNFIFKMDRLAPVKLMVDADADGWFIGKDNYLVYLRPKDEMELETELVMVNCADPKRWPFHDAELVNKIKIRSEIEMINDEYFIRVSIPKDEYTGVNLEQGEKLGVNIGFSVIMDAEGHQRYVTIFEPNRFFDVELVE